MLPFDKATLWRLMASWPKLDSSHAQGTRPQRSKNRRVWDQILRLKNWMPRSPPPPSWVVSTNPFEKYVCQIGSFPQVGVKIKNIWNHHLASILFRGNSKTRIENNIFQKKVGVYSKSFFYVFCSKKVKHSTSWPDITTQKVGIVFFVGCEIPLIVWKSQGQPPGMFSKPSVNDGISTTFPSTG